MTKKFVNAGYIHAVKCEWCGLAMSCNCWDGNQPDRVGHIVVRCPRCQVSDFLNLLFGAQDLRSVLVSRIQAARDAPKRRSDKRLPQLKLITSGNRR